MPGKIKFLENDSQFEDEKLGLKIAERLELVTRAYASFSGTGNRFKNPRKNTDKISLSNCQKNFQGWVTDANCFFMQESSLDILRKIEAKIRVKTILLLVPLFWHPMVCAQQAQNSPVAPQGKQLPYNFNPDGAIEQWKPKPSQDSAESLCEYSCITSSLRGMKPYGRAAEHLDKGFDLALWLNPQILKDLDNFLFHNTGIPFWESLQIKPGIYIGSLVGNEFDRKYSFVGGSVGVLYSHMIDDRHEMQVQMDSRFGALKVSRQSKSAVTGNAQSVLSGSYKYHADLFLIGVDAVVLRSSDENTLYAFGGGLSFGVEI